MQYAQQMVARKENLNNSDIFLPGYSSHSLLTAAAAHKRHQNIIAFALAHGADPNTKSSSGITPLRRAVMAKCAPNVEYLLAHGAQLGQSYLLHLICNPACDEFATNSTRRRIATLNALLEGGADCTEFDIKPSILGQLLLHFLGVGFRKENHEGAAIFLDQRKQMIAIVLQAGLNPLKKNGNNLSDWEEIMQSKKRYHAHLLEFTQNIVEKQKVQ